MGLLRLKDMNKKNKQNLIIGLIFFIFIICIFISSIYKSISLKRKIYRDYPAITRVDKFDCIVINKYSPPEDLLRNSPTIVFVTLDDNKKYRIWTEFDLQNGRGINEILEVGDKLVKKSRNDTIKLIKLQDSLTKRHLFLLINDTSLQDR
jgi:hypothetical protein